MKLSEVILSHNEYVDSDETIHVVFAKKPDDRFQSFSEALVLKLSTEEMELDLNQISNSKCIGFTYFLEMFIIQDFLGGLQNTDNYNSNDDKVNRVIYYAENDA
ncbi:hypothetical protein SAMN05421827_11141 [Pedobacter terrae]|uniref:Uncharacterized protein n=1 Tax=Pedobacter terrae TaxID=405671 RepID=A0A1G7X4Q2_9SPHI|nr:hypothetical protein [Pedobacter terrae]SDG78540.1 hypothetical protein SAMN05421827_11141 [Pedobacter terrae]